MTKTKNKQDRFSSHLKAWRRDVSRMSQGAAANSLDVPLATYRNWEQGRREPSVLLQSSIMDAMRRMSLE